MSRWPVDFVTFVVDSLLVAVRCSELLRLMSQADLHRIASLADSSVLSTPALAQFQPPARVRA